MTYYNNKNGLTFFDGICLKVRNKKRINFAPNCLRCMKHLALVSLLISLYSQLIPMIVVFKSAPYLRIKKYLPRCIKIYIPKFLPGKNKYLLILKLLISFGH